MKIFDPNNTSIVLEVIPRYLNVDNNHELVILNENNRETSSNKNVTKVLGDGFITYSFTFTSEENTTYSIKITDTVLDRVVWRDKAFATAQDTQKYKINV